MLELAVKRLPTYQFLAKRRGGDKTKNKNSTEKWYNLNCDESRADYNVCNAKNKFAACNQVVKQRDEME